MLSSIEMQAAAVELEAAMVDAEGAAAAFLASIKAQSGDVSVGPLGAAVFSVAGRANLAGLHVFEIDGGGWCAEVHLSGLPDGYGDVMRVPKEQPLGSRREALEWGVQAIGLVLAHEMLRGSSDQVVDPAFDFFGLHFKIPAAFLQAVRQMNGSSGYYPREAFVRSQLDAARRKYFARRPVSSDAFQRLPEEARSDIWIECAIALSIGIIRHAQRPPIGLR